VSYCGHVLGPMDEASDTKVERGRRAVLADNHPPRPNARTHMLTPEHDTVNSAKPLRLLTGAA
jgi:hypothetical protein